MRKELSGLFLLSFLTLLVSCEATPKQQLSEAKPAVEVKPTINKKLLVIQEDSPVEDSLLNWRVKANSIISFTHGEEEKKKAKESIDAYPNPAEVAEAKTRALIISGYGLDKSPKTISYKGRAKPSSLLSQYKNSEEAAYLLDYDIISWSLKPHPKNKSKLYVDLDMKMELIDLEKDSVLMSQKCYFSETGEAYSQFQLFNEDSRVLKQEIKGKATKCAEQMNIAIKEKLSKSAKTG